MRASTFPTIPPAERLSTKKNRMPPSTAAQVTRSSFPGLRRKKMAVNTITKMGAVNWRTMALAAVVILLAMEKRMLVPHTAKAPSRTQRFILGLWRMAHRYSPITTKGHRGPGSVDGHPVPRDHFDAEPPDAVQHRGGKDAQDASLLCGHDTAPFSVSLHISRPPELILRSLPRCSRPCGAGIHREDRAL